MRSTAYVRRQPGSLAWRLFALNALALVIAAILLVVTPVTVSSPVALAEAVVLAAGLLLVLLANLAGLRRHVAPLERLAEFMRTIDPLAPGRRVPVEPASAEVEQLAAAFNDVLDRLERERRDSARRALEAQESERRRIALELHDEVGQSLTGVVLELERIVRSVPEEIRPDAESAREVAREALQEVRVIASRLRPEVLEDFGLASSLVQQAQSVAAQAGIAIETSMPTDLPPLSPEQELVIYRVAQESLTNAIRHSGATSLHLDLQRGSGGLTLIVTDDGRGLPADALVSPRGIRGMRERAVLVGGRLELDGRPGGGTVVRLSIPLR